MPEQVKVLTDTGIGKEFNIPIEVEGFPIQIVQLQMTGASSSTHFTYKKLPLLAATARDQIARAYAKRVGIRDASKVTLEGGSAFAQNKGRIGIGELVRDAAKIKVRNAKPKTQNFRVIGNKDTKKS